MWTGKSVLILEDDEGAQFVYREILQLRYILRIFPDLATFKNALQEHELHSPPDLIIVDLNLPDGNFLKFLWESRAQGKFTYPFLVVSSMDDLDILRSCLKEGARDFLTKPFSKNALIVKIEKMLIGISEYADGVGSKKEIFIEPTTLTVRSGSQESLPLTAKELQIFSILYKNQNRPISRECLQSKVWPNVNVGEKTLDVHLVNLRKKISPISLNIGHREPDHFELM